MTTKGVEAIKPDPAKRIEIPNPALSGLYLVVQPSGAKSWALRYRFGGKPAKLTLGKWPMMGVADARTAATEALEAVEHGRNPAVAKKAAKADQREAIATERDKVKTLVAQFDKRHLSGLKRGREVRRALDVHVVAAWGERDIGDITKRDVIDLLDGIADSGRKVTANRVRAYLGKFLNWAVERDIISMNPAMGVKAVAKEVSRDRVLSDDEIRLLWLAGDNLGFPWGPFAKTLLLTGQRLNEVAQMPRAEIDGDLWSLPPDRTKNGRAHDVPLSTSALEVVAALPKTSASYVFSTNGTSPLQGFSKGNKHIRDKMAEIATEEAGEPVEIEHWTWHDLRRTCATGLARMGIPVRVTEACLNHVSGTAAGIVSVYQRHDYADEKRQALEAWARFVTELVEGKPDNVVRLAEAG
ncbi:tyrosine-type recombinase/integrase [Altericroceibacterium spongiae]|nr:site-specific integrase [Altericroceibacterium spongiae]